MIYHSDPIHCSDCGEHQKTARGGAVIRAVVAVLVTITILVSCAPEIPINVLVLPFLPVESRSGVYHADLAPLDVDALATVAPEFSVNQVPLNTVQLEIDPGPGIDPQGIVAASIDLGLSGGVAPPSESVTGTLESTVSIYLAPGDATNRFAPQYRIPLGQAELGTSAENNLTGDVPESLLDVLRGASILLGLEMDNTLASFTNTGTDSFALDGVGWVLTEFRIRGTAVLGL